MSRVLLAPPSAQPTASILCPTGGRIFSGWNWQVRPDCSCRPLRVNGPFRARRPWPQRSPVLFFGCGRIRSGRSYTQAARTQTQQGAWTAWDQERPAHVRNRMTGAGRQGPHPPFQQPQPFGLCLASLPQNKQLAGSRSQAGAAHCGSSAGWAHQTRLLRQSMARIEAVPTSRQIKASQPLAAAPDTTGTSPPQALDRRATELQIAHPVSRINPIRSLAGKHAQGARGQEGAVSGCCSTPNLRQVARH